jgi:hypothetical protein
MFPLHHKSKVHEHIVQFVAYAQTHSSAFLCAVFKQIMTPSSSTMPPLPSWLAAASCFAPRAPTHLPRTTKLSGCFTH